MGVGAVVGDAVWNRQSRARIRIGPVPLKTYVEFLPDGSAFAGVRAITRYFSNQCIEFELQLVLERDDVPVIQLDSDADPPARLGWTAWAKTKSMGIDPDDTILAL
jgi:type VI secretion system protein ImpH